MSQFVSEEAQRLGVSKAEFQRRLLEAYQHSRVGNASCDHCGGPVEIDLQSV
jgi:hypothetical protein